MPATSPARLLVTGFEPFGGDDHNPSASVVRALHGLEMDGARVVAAVLPCVFGGALDALDRALREWEPRLVLAVGQAAGRHELSLERVAINVDDARIPDNAGAQPVDCAVVPGGPAAYFSTLPIKAMAAALRAGGLPAGISQTAGTFVCNHVFYGLMHRLAGRPEVAGGFMHIPLSPRQVARQPGHPSMDEALVRRGLEIALATAWRHTGPDLQAPGGTLG
jgi:pyroglutamyl-peptidase